MTELQRAHAQGKPAATARRLLGHRIVRMLHQQMRDRLSKIAAGFALPCPTDVKVIAGLVDLASRGVIAL
jgi:hypothetical protein